MDMDRFQLGGQNLGTTNKNVMIGNAFAFLDPNALKDSDISWLAKLLGHKPGAPLIVSLAGPGSVELSGVKIAPLKLDQYFLNSIVSDKNLYRQGKDTVNLLVLSPTAPNSSVTVTLSVNGAVSSRHQVELGANGEGSLKLRDLLVGDYQLTFEGQEQPACEFVVAEYRLVPLVASLTSSAAGAADSLEVVLHLESFGAPVNGKVRLSLMDRHTLINTVTVVAVEAVAQATFQLKGTGPHTIAVQVEAEPSKTATVPLRGSREAERKNTVFSALGAEVVGSLLPISATSPVRGIYLKEGALKVSPITLERVDDDRAKLTVNANVSTMKVVVVDPTFPVASGKAVDVVSAPHPESDPVYKEAEEKFKKGKFAEACEKFRDRRSHFEYPHPYYAYWMACCYAKAGQVDEAVRALRMSIADGWTDFGHMENDEDLSSLRDYEPYQKLLSGGRTEVSFSNLSAGDKIEVDVHAPMSLILIGAIVDGGAWEGWASIVTPSTVSTQVIVPEVCTPGQHVTIKFEAETNGASIYAIIKDARLISADTPEMKLAAAIKNYVDVNGAKLSVGAPTDTLKTVLALCNEKSRQSTYLKSRTRGSWGEVETFGSGFDAPARLSLSAPPAPPGFGSIPPGAPPPGAQMMAFQQSYDEPGGTWGGGAASGSAWNTPIQEKFDYGGQIPSAGGGGSMTPADSIKSKIAESVDLQAATAQAKKPLTAISDEPEVLYAGFVSMKKGKGTVKIKLPDAFSNYIVECFAIAGMQWASKETRFKAAKDSYVQLTTPVFATRTEPGVGFVHVGSNKNAIVRVLFDGKPIALYDQNGAVFNGEVSSQSNSYTFTAESGHFEALLECDGKVVANHVKRVDEPGKLKRAVRSLKVLTAGESVALKDDPSLIGLRVLTGLENDFSVLLDATADYSHCCCEQTAAKILSGCVMYLQSNGDDNRKTLAESIIIAGIKREQSMWLRGQGFKCYPDVPEYPDQYVGPKAARYLWNVGLLESNGNGKSMSKDLKNAIASGLEMAQDTTKAYNLAWPPKTLSTCEDAYNALCFNPSIDGEATVKVARAVEQNGKSSTADPFFGRSVGTRMEQAYAAATLLRKGVGNDMKLALKLANTVISQFNEYGRLYSTVDSVAAIALMTELQKAGITKGGGKVEINGKAVGSEEATTTTDAIQTLKVLEGAVTVAIDRTVEEDWKKYEAGVPLRVSLEKNGEHSRKLTAGDTVDLVVTLEQGYTMGDLLWVALPDALSRVVGGGQVKLFALDFAGANELRVSLAATGTTEGRNRELKEQSLAVCVRNMFNEERAGNPGLIKISVKR